jgi:hypothetical protein
MFIGKSAVQELLELMMEYLDQKTIAACKFVNRQFSATAYPLLYRTILFNDLPEHAYNQWLQWRILHQFPQLCSHIRYFVINVWHEPQRPRTAGVPITRLLDKAVLDSLPPYTERVAFVLRHATNLTEVRLEDDRPSYPDAARKMGAVTLNSIIRSLNEMTASPEISLNIGYMTFASEEDFGGPEEEKVRDGLLQIRDRFRVTTLSCEADVGISTECLELVAGFRHLRKLRIFSFLDRADDSFDFDKLFRSIPITEFVIHIDVVQTLPRYLRSLVIGGECNFSQQTWAAVCNLQNLHTLDLDYSRPDANSNLESWNNYTIYRFKSSNLRVFNLGLFGNSGINEDLIISHILQPVFSACQLEHMAFEMRAIPLSSLLLESCFATYLSRLVLIASASPYSFECLANGLTKSRNLKRLTLPWPASMGDNFKISNESVLPWRSRAGDVSKRLTFRQAQHLARLCPKLDEIEFKMDESRETTNRIESWEDFAEFDYDEWDFTKDMPVDREKLGEECSRHYAFLQLFKMARFVEEDSPCLNVCTVFFQCAKTFIYRYIWRRPQTEIVFFLSLKQIRKHLDHL